MSYFRFDNGLFNRNYELDIVKAKKIDFEKWNPLKENYYVIKRNVTKDWLELEKMAILDDTQNKILHDINYGAYHIFCKTILSYNIQENTTEIQDKNQNIWSEHHKIDALKRQ